MRVNWFSPLASSAGMLELLPLLQERAEVVLWTTQAEGTGCLCPGLPVRCWQPEQPPWADLQAADVTFYHLDEKTADDNLLAVIGRHPGIVVLHGPAEIVPERALGVVVHERTAFDRLKSEDRVPVLYTEPPASAQPESSIRYVGALLSFAAEAPQWHGCQVAHDLASQAGAAMSLWMTAKTALPWLHEVSQEIQALSGT